MSWQEKSAAPPPGYAYGPPYQASLANRVRAIVNIAAGRPRSLARDAFLALRDMPHPPLVRGEDRLPERGPLVLVANHYERPRLWMAWAALIVSDLVLLRCGQETRWIAIQEWESFSLLGIPISPAVIRRVFERAFHTYGILAMPPPNASAVARASAIRAAVHEIRRGGIIGLMPEGTVGATPELLPAREGVGEFVRLLAGAGARIAPVGLYEEGERFVVHFDEPFALTVPPEIAKEARDAWVRDRVMRAIRDVLPPALWGVYR